MALLRIRNTAFSQCTYGREIAAASAQLTRCEPLGLCSKVPKAGDPAFKKENLPFIWEKSGAKFLADTAHQHGRKVQDSFKLPPEVRSKLNDEFCIVDADGSGALDPQERSDLFARLALQVSDQVCARFSTRCPLECASHVLMAAPE